MMFWQFGIIIWIIIIMIIFIALEGDRDEELQAAKSKKDHDRQETLYASPRRGVHDGRVFFPRRRGGR